MEEGVDGWVWNAPGAPVHLAHHDAKLWEHFQPQGFFTTHAHLAWWCHVLACTLVGACVATET